jgi:hypothetical protein
MLRERLLAVPGEVEINLPGIPVRAKYRFDATKRLVLRP